MSHWGAGRARVSPRRRRGRIDPVTDRAIAHDRITDKIGLGGMGQEFADRQLAITRRPLGRLYVERVR